MYQRCSWLKECPGYGDDYGVASRSTESWLCDSFLRHSRSQDARCCVSPLATGHSISLATDNRDSVGHWLVFSDARAACGFHVHGAACLPWQLVEPGALPEPANEMQTFILGRTQVQSASRLRRRILGHWKIESINPQRYGSRSKRFVHCYRVGASTTPAQSAELSCHGIHHQTKSPRESSFSWLCQIN
jgi:hypothetical protein